MEKEIQTVGHTLNFIRISNGAAIGKEFRVKICQIAAQSGLCESVVKDCINSLIKQGTITFLMRSDYVLAPQSIGWSCWPCRAAERAAGSWGKSATRERGFLMALSWPKGTK